MALTYRYATDSDVDAIVAIEESAMSNPWHKDNYLEAIHSDHAFVVVASEDDAIAGFAVFYLTPPESELPDIVVAEAYRKRGIAKAIARAISDAALQDFTDRTCCPKPHRVQRHAAKAA